MFVLCDLEAFRAAVMAPRLDLRFDSFGTHLAVLKGTLGGEEGRRLALGQEVAFAAGRQASHNVCKSLILCIEHQAL